MMSGVRRTAILIMAVIGAVFVLVWAKAFWYSMANYRSGLTYLEKQDFVKAITYFDRSLHWYTPLNPYPFKSAERLWEIGALAERNGDIRVALMSLRTLRRGFYAVRSFYTPGKEWISKSDDKISILAANISSVNEARQNLSKPSAKAKTSPSNVFWTIILELGLSGWIGSILGFLLQALTDRAEPELKSRLGISWGALFIVGYFLWVLGMVKA